MLTSIRPEILRYHYSSRLSDDSITLWYQGATFEEYFELCKIMSPGVTRWTAARSSPSDGVGHFLAELEKLGAEPVKVKTVELDLPYVRFVRQKECDVASRELPIDAVHIHLDRIKNVKSWSDLDRFRLLNSVSATLCGTEDSTPCESRRSLAIVDVCDCSPRFERVLLQSTSSAKISIGYSTVFDLDLLRDHTELEELFLSSQLARNFDALAALPLRDLHVSSVHMDKRVTQTLIKLKKTLTELSLVGTEPFGPDVIPLSQLKKLTRFSVTVDPEFRDAWLEVACASPHIYFDMSYAAAHDDEPKQKVTVAEIYRDIDILEIKKGKKTLFELSGEMTEYAEERGFEGDNGDLEDELKERARAFKVRGLKWSSEGDTLVVQAAKIEALRWVIDAIHEE